MPELLQSPEGTQLAPDPPLKSEPDPCPLVPELLKSPEGTQPAPGPDESQPATASGRPAQLGVSPFLPQPSGESPSDESEYRGSNSYNEWIEQFDQAADKSFWVDNRSNLEHTFLSNPAHHALLRMEAVQVNAQYDELNENNDGDAWSYSAGETARDDKFNRICAMMELGQYYGPYSARDPNASEAAKKWLPYHDAIDPQESPEGTQPAPDPPLKSPEGTQPVTDPVTLAPDSEAFVQPFEIIPLSEAEFFILEESLRAAGAHNKMHAIAVEIRKRIIAHQRTNGPDLYQFVLSPYRNDPETGSGVADDALQQVAWCNYLDTMESTSAWGSHLEVQSAAMVFDAKIYVWQLGSAGYVFHSVHGSGKQVWHFGFESERHYHFILHGSDHEGMRNLVVHLGSTPCISRTTPYRGSSEALLIGVYGDGHCLFSAIGMAALACAHPLVASHHIQLPEFSSLRLHELPNLAENKYITINNAEIHPGELAANAEILHLCQVSGHPLGEGSVVSDATKASLTMLSAAAAAHSGIAKLHKDIVWVFHLLNRRTYCSARWNAEAIRKASLAGLRLKVTRNLLSCFDGFTHVICDSTADVEKALGSNSVNLVIVVDSLDALDALLIKVPVDFKLVNVHGGTQLYAMFMRLHGVQQPPSPRLIDVPSRSFNATDVNILQTNVDRSAPPKFVMIKDGLKHTVLPNVAATMRNGTVTYMPGQYLMLIVDQAIVTSSTVIYRGIVQSGQSDSVIVYNDLRGNIGVAPPNQLRELNDNSFASKMTSEQIAEGFQAWLKEDVVKRNLTDEFSSKVTLITLITLITPNM